MKIFNVIFVDLKNKKAQAIPCTSMLVAKSNAREWFGLNFQEMELLATHDEPLAVKNGFLMIEEENLRTGEK